MAIPKEIKDQIIQFRKDGMTYTEINIRIGQRILKSNLSYICKNITLPKTYTHKIKTLNQRHLNSVRQIAITSNQEKNLNI